MIHIAYEKHNWVDFQEKATAEKLNHMEQGIYEASTAKPLIVQLTKTDGNYSANKTVGEIFTAYHDGHGVLFEYTKIIGSSAARTWHYPLCYVLVYSSTSLANYSFGLKMEGNESDIVVLDGRWNEIPATHNVTPA